MEYVIHKKTGRKIYIPTPEEDAAITAAALSDPDNPPLDDDYFLNAKSIWENPELVAILQKHGKLGRPPLLPEDRKKRVTLYLDPDVLAKLKAEGKGWQTRANAALRASFGL